MVLLLEFLHYWNFGSGNKIFRLNCQRQRVLATVVKMYWNPIDVEGIKQKLYSEMPEVVSGTRGLST